MDPAVYLLVLLGPVNCQVLSKNQEGHLLFKPRTFQKTLVLVEMNTSTECSCVHWKNFSHIEKSLIHPPWFWKRFISWTAAVIFFYTLKITCWMMSQSHCDWDMMQQVIIKKYARTYLQNMSFVLVISLIKSLSGFFSSPPPWAFLSLERQLRVFLLSLCSFYLT